ncbi:hypothetical protein VA596_42815 [Amycolatopsis sp., V23-08]|uniref:Uncharacterized protein n=1 Tax=Amycolatopsis heterodermiae TaxID=3110235 RepID=A0ABU5RL81_9PSEU|nr:hypothetical protein [Amycolatopsis sp., V23-08]MEA5366324.1 hypothetical protein [Amycolatopsis sp., V23-08]
MRLDTAGQRLLFTEARTVKRFSATPVGDDRLAGIWDLARWPPTSSNTSRWTAATTSWPPRT